MSLTAERLRAVLHYDPTTGLFTWIKPTSNRVKVGQVAKRTKRDYVTIRIDKVTYAAGRLAWLYMRGVWPTNEIDHWNGDHGDNVWTNLRDVTHKINQQNIREPHRDSTGLLGVIRRESGRFEAKLWVGDRYKNLGHFDTAEDAHAAYVKAKRIYHEGCTI